jgi:hypothetical protein
MNGDFWAPFNILTYTITQQQEIRRTDYPCVYGVYDTIHGSVLMLFSKV